MSKKSRLGLDILISKPQKNEITGIKLSQVRYVEIDTLRENPINSALFKKENEQYFSTLEADIKERGILVPLIAKRDGTLLSGHNRLYVAKQLGFSVVPVQYVEDELTNEQETGFLIKDNLYRRHLSQAEWVSLYKKMYPDFESWIESERRGRRKKDMSFISETPTLSAEKIAHDTGQSVAAVKKQIVRLKNDSKAQQKSVPENDMSKVLQSATAKDAAVVFSVAFLKKNNLLDIVQKNAEQKGRGELVIALKDIIALLQKK